MLLRRAAIASWALVLLSGLLLDLPLGARAIFDDDEDDAADVRARNLTVTCFSGGATGHTWLTGTTVNITWTLGHMGPNARAEWDADTTVDIYLMYDDVFNFDISNDVLASVSDAARRNEASRACGTAPVSHSGASRRALAASPVVPRGRSWLGLCCCRAPPRDGVPGGGARARRAVSVEPCCPSSVRRDGRETDTPSVARARRLVLVGLLPGVRPAPPPAHAENVDLTSLTLLPLSHDLARRTRPPPRSRRTERTNPRRTM